MCVTRLVLGISPCKKLLALHGDKSLSYVLGNLFASWSGQISEHAVASNGGY